MEKITFEQLPEWFEGVAAIFTEKKDELCDMDAKMGDGDLGLTMHKGYAALPDLIRENSETGDVGKTLMKSGMKMASVVPSTMGTLMSSGVMEGGMALKGKSELGPAELATYLTAFAAGVQKRGKCALGDRTILDAVDRGVMGATNGLMDGKMLAGTALSVLAIREWRLAGLAVPGAMTLLWWAARLFGGDRL